MSGELLFFKGTRGRIPRMACMACMNISKTCFSCFGGIVLDTVLDPSVSFWAVLASNLAPFWRPSAVKMKPEMQSQLQKAKTLNLHIVAQFSLFFSSPSPHKRHQDRDKIILKLIIFATFIHRAIFSHFYWVFMGKLSFWGSFGYPRERPTFTLLVSVSVLGAFGQ